MHLSKRAQIAHLRVDEVFIKVLSKNIDFVNFFLPKLVIVLSKYMRINNYAIKLIDDW